MKGTKTEVRPGVWRLRVYAGRRPNGTPIQQTKTLVTPEAEKGTARPGDGARLADTELAKMVADVSRGRTGARATTVDELLDHWLDHCRALGRSPTTLRKYEQIADSVVRPALGKVRLGKLQPRDLDRLYATLTAKGNKPTTVRRVHALIGAALHQAERWGWVDRSVARQATPPPVHAAQVTAPAPDDVRALVAAAEAVEPMMGALLLVAALTGARRGELCGLQWSDVDWDDGILTIGRSVYEVHGGGWDVKPTKTHAVRRVGLDDLALEVLRRHRRSVDELATSLGVDVAPDGYIFSRSPAGAEPVMPAVVTKFTTRVAKSAGLDTHLHALRHFSATQAIGAGFDPVTVAARLGHADPGVTLRVYSHAIAQRDRELAASLGRALMPG